MGVSSADGFERKWGRPEQMYLRVFGVSPEALMNAQADYSMARFGEDLRRELAAAPEYRDLVPPAECAPGTRFFDIALAVCVCEAHDLGFFSFHEVIEGVNELEYNIWCERLLPFTNLLTAFYIGNMLRGTKFGLSAQESMNQIYQHLGETLRPLREKKFG